MAPRRNSSSSGYRTGTETGRAAGAGLFDLRESEKPFDEERPYRERHRVEVAGEDRQIQGGGRQTSYRETGGSRVVRGNAPGRYQTRGELDDSLFSGNQNRAGAAGGYSPNRQNTSGAAGGYSPRRQNTAGAAGGYSPRRQNTSGAAGSYSARRQNTDGVDDSLFPGRQRSARPGADDPGNAARRTPAPAVKSSGMRELDAYRQRIRDFDIDVDAYDTEYRGRRRDSRDTTPLYRDSRTGAGADSYSRTGTGAGPYSRTGAGAGSYSRTGAGTGSYERQDRRTGSGGREEYEYADPRRSPETDGTGARSSRGNSRARMREAARKEREKQLRSLYIRMGAGAALVLLLLILIPVAVFRLRRDKGSPAAGDTMLAQQEADLEQGESGREDTDTVQDADEPGREETDAEGQEGSSATGTGSGEEQNAGEKDASGGGREGIAGGAGDASETELAAQGEAAEMEIGSLADSPGDLKESGSGKAGSAKEEADDTPDPSGQEEAAGQEESGEKAEASPAEASETSNGTDGQKQYTRQDEWNLLVVNPWKEIPEDYTFDTTSLPNGESVDSRCYDALVDMLEACRAAGNDPVVCSAFRTHEKQVQLFEDEVASQLAKGLNREEAEKAAATEVARPLTSEHELGLAVDLCDSAYQALDDKQAETPTQKWLLAHCWEYGFVLRFPVNKGQVTGIIFEPWHYRYVGREAAEEMYNEGNWICLEEYLAAQ